MGLDTITSEQSSPTISKRILRTASTFKTLKSDGTTVTVCEVTPTRPTITNEKTRTNPAFWEFTFTSTFDAVSEFTNSASIPNSSTALIGAIATAAILTIYLLALWQNNWVMSIGWILVVCGYIGIVFTVTLAAMLITSSCISLKLSMDPNTTIVPPNSSTHWIEGMVVLVKNVDSMSTTGSSFVTCPSPHQTLEAIYIKPLTSQTRSLTTFITLSLILSFISHYLGLRPIKWWASICELLICIIAAFARSVSNEIQPRFAEVPGVKVDKRCSSTGIIRTQTSRLIDVSTPPIYRLDARSYSSKILEGTPNAAEKTAYQTAKLIQHNPKLRNLITSLTKLHLITSCSPSHPHTISILLTFTGGILVTEGLTSTPHPLLLSFSSDLSSLSSPASLLGRAIMQQPEWILEEGKMKGLPLGNVYVFAMQSLMDWWTVSEDRNDLGDLGKNLGWPLFLVSVGWFLELGDKGEEEVERVLQGVFGEGEVEERKVAGDVVGFLEKLEH